MKKPLDVFCCYAHADQSYLFELRKRLIPLQREGLITIYADIDISPGEEWETKIHQYLNTAHIILLLISPDFLASEYCYSKEMLQALKRHNEKAALVIPIILRPVDLRRMSFSNIQSLPANATPVTKWANQDDAFFDITHGIEKAIEKLLSRVYGVKILPIELGRLESNFESKKPTQEQHRSQHTQQHTKKRLGLIWSWIKSLTKLKSNKRYCPRCYEEFFLEECDIVATLPPDTAGEVLYVARKNNVPAGSKPKPIRRELLQRMGAYVCSRCGYLLPYNIDRVPLITIAVVGDVSSGKSYYITALIKQLQDRRIASRYEYFRMVCITPAVEERYIQDYFRPLLEGEVLPRTRPLSSGELIDPLIYELTLRHEMNKYKPKTVNIVIHDASGEDYYTPQKMTEFARHVINASGLIYLVDPLSMSKVVEFLPLQIQKPVEKQQNSSTILNRITSLILYHASSGYGRLSNLPVAVTVSKVDMLQYLRPITDQYKFMVEHVDGLDLLDLKQTDMEVRNFIEEFGDVALLQVAMAFRKRHFFAISATGHLPDQQGAFQMVEPLRCLDPLLWIFYELGLISVK